MRTLIIEEMRRSIPPGSLDKSIKFHKTDNLPLWAAGDIDLSSVDWSKKMWIFDEAAEDRADREEDAAFFAATKKKAAKKAAHSKG